MVYETLAYDCCTKRISLYFANLHVVVSAECFVADRAGELGWTHEDLGWTGNPVLSVGKNVAATRVT